jgi:uncharacterized protein YkwD
MKKTLLLLLISVFAISVSAQKSKGKERPKVNDENFRIDDLSKLLIAELNKFRKSKGLDTLVANETLFNAASINAGEMADAGKTPKADPSTTQSNLKSVGATRKGEELVMAAPISKGRESYKTDEVAKTIYNRWESNKKDLPVVLNPKYVMVGISCETGDDGKKVYVSAVFGGYDITNEGAEMKSELTVPYNTKSKKLKAPDQKACKNCEKWKNYDNLQKGLYVENGKVYLKYSNLKELKRLLKKPKDGLAVDIVQREQYKPAEYNIVDNNLYNKGIMSKVLYKDKLFKKNRIKPDPKAKKKIKINKLDVELGKFDPKITGPYELNLIVVQDGKVCKTVTRSYLENGDQESNTPIGILPAPETKGLKPPFEPRSESSIINFKIPFERNKFEFKDEDIAPLVTALNEPDFIIEGLYIYAYSSIEGDSVANAKLQRKRAESVSNVLQSKQSIKVKPVVEPRDSWDLFLLENEDGKYADLVNMGKRKAIDKINSDKALLEELEPILARERFAQIIMDVTYDVTGNKEQKFSTVSFSRALKANKENQAYKIMEYVAKKVNEKKYSPGALDSLEVPNDSRYVNLMNNKVHYRFLGNGNTVDEDDYAEIDRLYKMDPSNDILRYNRLYCAIKLDTSIGDQEAQAKVQQSIDDLYKSKIDKKYLDGLNIEWQFKLIEVLDTTDTPAAQAAVEACINRIKSFYDLKDASWQNALKLAYVFARAKDYMYASSLLEPYLNEKSDENLVYAYISIASHLPEKFYSRMFANALSIAKNKNQERYCKLFGEPFMSFQVLENPVIKKEYLGAGCN